MPSWTPEQLLVLEMSRRMISNNVSLYELMPSCIKILPTTILRHVASLVFEELGCRAALEEQLSHQPPGGASARRKAKGPGKVLKRPAGKVLKRPVAQPAAQRRQS